MPGTFNPVSGNPVSGATHSKSFRHRLGFGMSSGGVSSIKPSFFSQLNLKSGRKSFGAPVEFQLDHHPVLVIDPEPVCSGTPQENRVVLDDGSQQSRTQRDIMRPHFGTPSKKGSPPRSKNNLTHSLPASPIETNSPLYFLNSRTELEMNPVDGSSTSRVDPDSSGLSKHLPDFSTNISLLVNELPPDTASCYTGSQVSDIDVGVAKIASNQQVSSVHTPFPGSSPATLESHDQTERWDLQNVAGVGHNLRSVVSSPPNVFSGDLGPSKSATFHSTTVADENTSASFDLSSAKLSLDLVPQSVGEEWGRSVIVKSSFMPNAATSAFLLPPESSMTESGSGPITSTPFLSPSASPSESKHEEPEISFDLDALDPDLVALLRPNNYHQQAPQPNRIATPSPSEPFAPPSDPLNPSTAVKHSVNPTTPSALSPPSSQALPPTEAFTPSPERRFATISASVSSSPVRQLRLPRSYTVQEIFPQQTSKSTSVYATPSLEAHEYDGGQPSPSSAVTLSDTGTPSDMSKQPSPLSAPPLTLDELQYTPYLTPLQSSSNVTTRRNVRAVPTQIQSPVSVIPSSRPTPRYTLRNRDPAVRLTSTSPDAPGPSTHRFGSTGRERERIRAPIETVFSVRPNAGGSERRPSSAGSGRPADALHSRFKSSGLLPHPKDRGWESSVERRYRKRSMSLDQSLPNFDKRTEELRTPGDVSPRSRTSRHRKRMAESVGHGGSEYAYDPVGGLGAPYDTRDLDRDRERYGCGYEHVDRERFRRLHTDWLGPRTAKAFAAAGLLDDTRDAAGPKYGGFTRSASERDFRMPGSGSSCERRSPVGGRFPSTDGDRDREPFRYSLTTSVRSGDPDLRSSGVRSGAVSPGTVSANRPLSRGDSWSHSRPAPLYARTMSDLMSHREGTEGRDSVSGIHPRTGSAYSAGGGGNGGSNGSGGGRASPTTTSSLFAAQSQIQFLKDKHDAQTEALLAALADSQRTSRELREQNDALNSQVRSLEERLAETIASSRNTEKALSRAMRARPVHSPDRTRTTSHRDLDLPMHLRPSPPSRPPARRIPSPMRRRLSTSSSIFPAIPGSMSLLMAETPGSPPHGSLGSNSSPPPSPTLVLPRLTQKQKSSDDRDGTLISLPTPQTLTMAHKRSTSGASNATSANFSFETGSPGSLKLKPEHELLLGDMTRLSLLTGFGGDSEAEG